MNEHLEEGAREVARTLRKAGYQALYAGGCVRDLLLGLPCKDYDIATDATPRQVTKLFRRTIQVGAAFGVVRVLDREKREYEVATFRTDSTYTDGRRPDQIEYSDSADEDVHRRDFTINALLMDPETHEIIDLVDGRKDLEAGIIRSVGDAEKRFGEDRLRMLRAVRFATRLDFEIEAATFAAIKIHASELKDVSEERIVAELHGLWRSARPARGLALFRELGLLAPVFPYLADASDSALDTLGERLVRLPELSLEGEALFSIAWALHFMACSGPVDVGAVEGHLRAHKLSRSVMREVLHLLRVRDGLLEPAPVREGERVRWILDAQFSIMHAFVHAVSGADSEAHQFWEAARAKLEADPVALEAKLRGEDLMALGIAPGPEFKDILNAVELEVYERRLSTKDEAIAWVRENYSRSVST